ncbi:MAG: hypothetical protein LLG04_18635 [Parachlamydia sp.]|nr:hypothetical protein [Parachlamydia sp.]
MIIEKELKKIFHQLVKEEVAQIAVGGTDITIRVLDRSKFSLSTAVYFGGNFIPKSVRNCVAHKGSLPQERIKTYLTVDEPNFKIFLNYVGSLENLRNHGFGELLEEFSWAADEWRLILDEHDRNDLIHVRVP